MRRLAYLPLLLVFAAPLAAQPVPPDHAAKMAAGQQLFKEKVRGLLVENCLECHGGAKTKSDFSLASRETLLKGGDRGPAVVPHKSADSLLVKLVTRKDEPHMPPKKPLSKEAVELLAKWIDLGAPYDKPLVEATDAGAKKPMVVTEKDRQYWAYRGLRKTQVPSPKSDIRNPIDAFIFAKLEEKGIVPAAPADTRTLLRRVYFDLVGLPPTPEELAECEKLPFAEVVDKLLASPRFGERWARHWLDPARYAESHGFEHDYFRPFAYHYRDFVIRAFNSNMPYDQFVKWQVAGDELAPGDPLALAATGFLGAGVYPTQITTREAERVRYDAMDDMLATTGHAVLALTVGCARCHDHKYDPIPTRDYYRMLSAFTTTVRAEIEVDLGTPEERKAMADFEARLKPLADDLREYEATSLPNVLAGWIAERKERKLDPPKVADANAAKGLQALWDGKAAFDKLPKPQRDAVVKWFGPQADGWKARKAKVTELEKSRPKDTRTKIQATTEGAKPMRHHTADGSIPDFYPETFVLKRGDAGQKEGPATLGFLQVLMRHPDGERHWFAERPKGATTSFRRVGLANFLVDVEHGAGALAARVIVNRLWHHHFGRGIVSTLNDFGFQAEAPTHPELLEWLANDLVAHGWDLKRLHKMMVTSRVYALSGEATDSGRKLDPDNRLWHSRPRRRLEAEAIRDNLLAVGGVLDATMYGPGTLDQGMRRRSIYFTVQRSQLIPMLQVFDWPDTLTSSAARTTTVVAPQALLFLNNPHVRKWAEGFAGRLKAETVERSIGTAYRIAFARDPSKAEVAAGVAFVREHGLTEYALALMSLNEFIYVD